MLRSQAVLHEVALALVENARRSVSVGFLKRLHDLASLHSCLEAQEKDYAKDTAAVKDEEIRELLSLTALTASAATDPGLLWMKDFPREMLAYIPVGVAGFLRLRIVFDLILQMPLRRGTEASQLATALRDMAVECIDTVDRLLHQCQPKVAEYGRPMELIAVLVSAVAVCFCTESLNSFARGGINSATDHPVLSDYDQDFSEKVHSRSRHLSKASRSREGKSSVLASTNVSEKRSSDGAVPSRKAFASADTFAVTFAASSAAVQAETLGVVFTPASQKGRKAAPRRSLQAKSEVPSSCASIWGTDSHHMDSEALRSHIRLVGEAWIKVLHAERERTCFTDQLLADADSNGLEESRAALCCVLSRLIESAGDIASDEHKCLAKKAVSSLNRGSKRKLPSPRLSRRRRKPFRIEKRENPRDSDWAKSSSESSNTEEESDIDFPG